MTTWLVFWSPLSLYFLLIGFFINTFKETGKIQKVLSFGYYREVQGEALEARGQKKGVSPGYLSWEGV